MDVKTWCKSSVTVLFDEMIKLWSKVLNSYSISFILRIYHPRCVNTNIWKYEVWTTISFWVIAKRVIQGIESCSFIQYFSLCHVCEGKMTGVWKKDDCVFKKQDRIMFFIPDKIAYFTDEVAKSRIKIFQLWRKLLAFTFLAHKKNHPVLGCVDFHLFFGKSFSLTRF